MIPLLAMLGVAVLSVLWPGPKVDDHRNESGAIFAPQYEAPAKGFTESPQKKAPADIAQDYSPLIPCGPDNCGKKPQ